MIRSRFKADPDYRPIKWPPAGPYWCSGYGGNDEDEYSIVIAYTQTEEQILEYWPEATDIESKINEITFSDRFPKPEWWPLAECYLTHNDKRD